MTEVSRFVDETLVIGVADKHGKIHELVIEMSRVRVLGVEREPVELPGNYPYIKREPGPITVVRLEMEANYRPEWRERSE